MLIYEPTYFELESILRAVVKLQYICKTINYQK